jgi:hypothetical protein
LSGKIEDYAEKERPASPARAAVERIRVQATIGRHIKHAPATLVPALQLDALLNGDDMSERLNLDTPSLKTYFGRPNLVVLQIACADFGDARELVVTKAEDNVYPGLGASDPISVLIESKRDVGGIELPISDLLPGTMCATEHRMCVPASKESTIRRKGKKVLSYTTWATGCHDPRPNQTSIGFDGSVLAGDRRRHAPGNDHGS